MEDSPQKNPLKGKATLAIVLVGMLCGLGSLFVLLSPSQIVEAFNKLDTRGFLNSMVFFGLANLLAVKRWRACLGFRVGRSEAFHSLGVANAGNLFIFGRVGEALRVYWLAKLGLKAQYGTSGLVQERLGDQVLRVVFIGSAALMSGFGSAGSQLGARLASVIFITVSTGIVLAFLVKKRQGVARVFARVLSRIPGLEAPRLEKFCLGTLEDLSDCWTGPGGKKALLYGLLTWLCYAVHTELILDSYFDENTLAFALLILAFTPATAPTQPGLFHGLAISAILILGGSKVPGMQAAVVVHMIQTVAYALWGAASWLWLNAAAKK